VPRYHRFIKLVTGGRASGSASASITPQDKYVWAWSRSIHKQIASKDRHNRRCGSAVRCRALQFAFATEWRDLNCNASMLAHSSEPTAPMYLTSSKHYCFPLPTPRVCQRQISACRTARVYVCYEGEQHTARTVRCYVRAREKLSVIRAQLIDSSARSAFF